MAIRMEIDPEMQPSTYTQRCRVQDNRNEPTRCIARTMELGKQKQMIQVHSEWPAGHRNLDRLQPDDHRDRLETKLSRPTLHHLRQEVSNPGRRLAIWRVAPMSASKRL